MAANQLWVFVLESTDNNRYCVGHQFLNSFPRWILCMQLFFKLVKSHDPVERHSYWLHSVSMSAAVQLLDDNLIMGTAKMYCRNDPIVTIYIRDELDPSPNTSRAVSHAISLNERRKISGHHQAPDVIIREPKRNTSQSLDIISREPVRSLPVEDQVIIDLGKAKPKPFRRIVSMVSLLFNDTWTSINI